MYSVSPEKIFQFRYINVPMLKNPIKDDEGNFITDDDGNVSGDEFTLKRLEVIGRILPNGLDIEVSISQASIICMRNKRLPVSYRAGQKSGA